MPKKWRSADGKTQFPSDMTTLHILRAIRICELIPPTILTIDLNFGEDLDCDVNPDYEIAQEWIQIFEKELKKRSTDYNEVDTTLTWLKRKNKYDNDSKAPTQGATRK